MALTVSIRDLRTRLAELIDAVTGRGEHVIVTRNGRPQAMLIDLDEYESMEETIELLSDPDAIAAIEEGRADFERGDYVTLAQFRAEHAARRPTDP